MVQRPVTTCHKKTRETRRNIKASKSSSQSKISKRSQDLTTEHALHMQEKNNQIPGPGETGRETHDETEVVFIPLVEEIKQRRRAERLAKERQAQEDRERFVKEATARKVAERAEIVKHAKRFILFRKPMCRRINRALLISEGYRELDAQMKFQETLKTVDKEEEMAYAKLMKADVAKYEEEKKQVIEKELEKQKNYAVMLKKQIEDNERSIKAKEKDEFETEKQDQSDTSKYLQDMKEHEVQELLNRKQKLEQFFRDAIEEKKRFDLKLKREDEFEDRAIEIYQNAKAQIKKLHKALASREKEEGERRAELTMEQFRTQMKSTEEVEEQILQRALEEQEARHQEEETARKERQIRMRKELQDFQMESTIAKSKQLQEEKEFRAWEMMQRFRKAEQNKQLEAEEQRQERNKKIDYGTALTKYISENKTEHNRNKILEDDSINMKHIVEKENQKVLNYAEEVLNESNGVRPLYPILKAIQECKKEMNLIPTQKRGEITMDTVPKRRQRVLRKCTKFVPEDQILYLQ